MATQLFLSHISEERGVAIKLQAMLEQVFSGDVKVFTSSDVVSIRAGKNWLTSVQDALKQSSAVVVLCSHVAVQRSWVQFELGGAWMLERPIIPVCHSGLKPRDLPLPLSLLEGADISAEGLQRLYDAVAHELKTSRKADPALMAHHLDVLRQEESRATFSPPLQFERFFDIVVPAPGRLASDEIPEATVVESNDESWKLFGFISGPRTWREIKKAAQKTKDQRWLKELQACVHLASQDEAFRPVQAIYHNPSGSFQPQLAKKEFMPDGTCRFHVHLVETVVAPLTEVQNEFGLLATLLRLGLRFRYEVIQKYSRALMTAAKARDSETLAHELRAQLRNAIEVIENDALSRGAENIDRTAVAELFNRDDDQQVMAQVQDDWDSMRARLFHNDPAPGAALMRDIVGSMREINFKFMNLGTRRFHEMVAERWRSLGPGD